ncbi:MAG: beta-N-acetylhexosaminidase [Chloroflexi bacterium]|nr:beta-N-acetylhexosaminidase [Chloroflexota bacterium]
MFSARSLAWLAAGVFAIFAVPLAAGCALSGASWATSRSGPAAPPEAAVDRLLAGMSLEEKVGQLMIVAFPGPVVLPDTVQIIRDYHAGGIILFQQNLRDPARVKALTAELQRAARIPLLVAVDQEGGPVVRLLQGVTVFPSQMAIGATGSPELAASVGRATASELHALGINTNFAPVVDVNSNPKNPVIGTRSYGADPAAAGRLAAAAIDATQKAGVLAVAKHFPGHGDADVDSHRALPVIDHDVARLDRVELPPFRAAIAAGVDGIMTAHVLLPALERDPKRPATLSAPVLRYLRETLGYRGLIITDDLEMGAVVNDYGTAEAAKLAFEAGADVLLFRRDVAEQRRAHTLLVSAVHSGEIPVARLDASVKRILEAKARRGVLEVGSGIRRQRSGAGGNEPSAVSGQRSAVGGQYSELNLEVARRGLTLAKNDGGLLPLRPAEEDTVCVVHPRPEAIAGLEVSGQAPGSLAPVDGDEPRALGDAVKVLHANARAVPVGLRPASEEMRAALECARQAQVVILGSYDLHEHPRYAALLQEVVKLGKPTVVVALRLPYDLAHLDGAPVLLATYSSRPVSLRAAAEAIFGKAPAPTGRLPVPVEPRWPLGWRAEN